VRDDDAAAQLCRIAQEATCNAVRHGRARHVRIGLAVRGGGGVELTVRDDGVGFGRAPAAGGGMGLHIMHYRARMIGASIDIRAAAGGGTVLTCAYAGTAAAGAADN
jgi:two-component system CheB/CheR fusion protein